VRALAAIPVLLLALLVAGCGGDDEDDVDAQPPASSAPPPTTTAPSPPSSAAPPATSGGETGDQRVGGGGAEVASSELTIRVWPDGRSAGAPQTYTLTCLPDGGTLPDPALACEAVRSVPFLFEPPPTDRACTEQYGGPAVAEVEGRVQDIAVDHTFDRTDGCAIAEWDRAAPLLPLPDGAAPS
jgi:hypothetical protein